MAAAAETPLIEERVARRWRAAAGSTGLFGASVSVLVLVGWISDLAILKSLLPGYPSMQANTALCFLLCSSALWLLSIRQPIALAHAARPVARGSAVLALLIALMTLAEMFWGLDLRIDQLIFTDPQAADGHYPGRMAGATALGLTALASALILLDAEIGGRYWPAEWLGLYSILTGLCTLLGYAFDAQLTHPFFAFNSVALHTGILFVVVGCGVFAARPQRGIVAVLASRHVGGYAARRILPVTIGLILALTWLRLQGQKAGLYGAEFASAIDAAVDILIFLGVVWVAARALNHSDAQRDHSDAAAKLAHDRLSLSEERTRLALEASGTGTWHWNLQSGILDWSRTCRQIFGFPPDIEINYDMFLAAVHSDFRAQVDQLCHQAMQQGQEFRAEFIAVRRDGTERWLSALGRGYYDAQARPSSMVGTVWDITERKQAERALHTSTLRLQAALEVGGIGTWVLDLGEGLVLADKPLLKLFGLSADTPAIDRIETYVARVHPDDQAGIRAALEASATEGREYDVKCQLILPDGSTRWIAAKGRAELDINGRPGLMTGACVDVSALVRAKVSVHESEARLNSIIGSAMDAIITVDEQQRVILFNTAAENMFRCPVERALGQSIEQFVPERFRAAHGQHLSRFGGTGVTNRAMRSLGALAGVRADGEEFPIEASISQVQIDGRRLFTVIMRDISERKHIEDALRQSQKMEALGTLAGGIAHDFNNILTAIVGNAGMARSELADGHPAHENLEEISRASNRAAELVKRILTFSRKQEGNRKVAELRPIVEDALKLLRASLPASIEISSTIVEGLPPSEVDINQIHQVLMNLATNSAQALPDSTGRIELTVKSITFSPEQAALQADLKPGDYLRLTVSDNGTGMDQATQQRIFEPFFTTKIAGQGTGLGLSIVHGIVASHGGAINVYSQPGKGTAISIFLPVATRLAVADAAPRSSDARGHGERVLHVDDEKVIVAITSRTLQKLGYQVTSFCDPAEALQAFQTHPDQFDVVVTDLSMPGLSGFDLSEAMIRMRSDLPIFLTSGYVRAEDAEKARQLGIRDVFLKPDIVASLQPALAELFRNRIPPTERAATA